MKKHIVITSCFFLVLFSAYASVAQDLRISSIAGGKKHACLLKSPTNLLISLARKKVERVLLFDIELKNISKQIKRTNSKITALKTKTDKVSKITKKKLKTSVKNLKLLSKGIIACRDGVSLKGNGSDCTASNVSDGAVCDDLNPCTTNDKCQNKKCIGSAIADDSKLNCSFGECSKVLSQCLNGKFVACIVSGAGSELCNQVDDDCNGEIDEKNVCNISSQATATVSPSQSGVVGTPLSTAVPTALQSPTATRTATATATKTLTLTPTKTPTPTKTSTPAQPFTCIPPVIPGANNNPNGCPCNTNGDCIGNCQCGNPCNNTTNPCPSGTTCITDPNDGAFGSCSGVCPSSPFSKCIGGGGNVPICVTGNTANLSAAGCPCTINGNCIGDCKCGNPCNVITNPCPAGKSCNPDGSCSGECKASPANVCT